MELKELFQKLAKNNEEVYSITGKVKDIDQTERTCTVTPLNGDAELFGVRLQAGENGTYGWCLFPKADSIVVVTFLNKQTGYIALCSDVEKVEYKVNAQTITMDTNGLKVEGFLKVVSPSSDLKSALNEFIDLLAAAVIVTPAGAGSFDPSLIANLQLLKAKFNTFLS
jgi:hypothetical protein